MLVSKQDEKYIFMPLSETKFEDLFDWSKIISRGNVARKTDICRSDVIKSGSLVHLNGEDVALFRYGEKVYAINERCHLGGPLHLGDIEELNEMHSLCVRCPWHSWRFDLVTGKPINRNDGDLRAKVYPVIVNNEGVIYIGFSSISSQYFNTFVF
ncbi:Uncharacterised protein g3802 [Pycnogonum litorale]